MSIKHRVLEKLTHVETELHTVVETGNFALLNTVTQELATIRDTCHTGLPQKFSAVYDEVFDGIATAMRQLPGDETEAAPAEVLLLCSELLRDVASNISKEQHFKKEIVFLPYKASMWDSMESVWQAAVDDSEHAIAYVVPIPYFDRDPDGNVREWHLETNSFPKYVPVRDCRRIDLEAMHPDIIVIHNPYDDRNRVTSIDPRYYSHELKQYTDKLVYIPYFVLEEIDPDNEKELESIAHFVLYAPGVRNADLIIVQSEDMREAYIRLLTRYTDKTERDYWEKRVLGLGSPKFDKVLSTNRDDIKLPKEWRRLMEKRDGTKKKVILYNTGVTTFIKYKEKLLDKMAWVFEQFRDRQDEVVLLWRPHPLFEATVKSTADELWERYRGIVERYRSEAWGIYDDSEDLHRAVALSDGYYGDASSVTKLFQALGKPIMLQAVRCMEPLF